MKRSVYIGIVLTLMLVTGDWGIGRHRESATTLAVEAPMTWASREMSSILELPLLAQRGCRKCPDGTGPSRGVIDPLIPYIISPRSTLLLTDRPTLRWNEVPGATRYTVGVRSPKGVIWETQVSKAEVDYPGQPPLEPGVDYLLIVEADNGRSSQEEDVPGRGFRLLNADDAQLVRDASALLAKQKLMPQVEALLRAYIYNGYYLRAEAIETLAPLVKGGSQEVAVYRTFGDLYMQVGLAAFAESPYIKALDLIEPIGDRAEQAALLARLGEVYVALGSKEKAVQYLTQALNLYKTLGNTQRVRELERRLEELKG